MQKNKITGWQLCFVVLQTQMGISALSMPTDVAKKAGQDAWISMILSGLAVQLIILIYIWLLRRCRSSSYFEFLPIIFGKFAGKTLLIFTVLYIIFVLIVVTVSFQQLVNDWINTYTPGWVIILLLLIPSLYLAMENINLIARFSMLISFLMPLLFFVVLFFYTSPQIYYILPIGFEGIKAVLEGVIPALTALSGFEMILFISHYLKENKTSEVKKGMIASGLVSLFYVYLIISVQLFFYIDELKIVPYPVLYIMKALSLMIIDRVDILFLTSWVIISTAVCINYLFVAGVGLQSIFNLKTHKYAVFFIAFLIFILSVFIDSKNEIAAIRTQLFTVGMIVVAGFPVLTLMVSLIRKKVGNQ